METQDIFYSLDESGELRQLARDRKWPLVIDWCDRRLKRGSSREAIQILRIIAVLHGPTRKSKLGKRVSPDPLRFLTAQCDSVPPITKPNALILLEALFQSYHAAAGSTMSPDGRALYSASSKIWERAAQEASSTDLQWIYQNWLGSRLRKGRYHDAKQAAMVWMKAYPRAKKPYFMFIILNHLISQLISTKDKERLLCQMLAYRSLSSIASSSVDQAGKLIEGTGRTINCSEDLRLLCLVYNAQNRYKEALDLLIDDKRGFNSPIGNRRWEILLQIVETLEKLALWDELWKVCYEVLVSARQSRKDDSLTLSGYSFGLQGDDWRIWSAFVIATGHSKASSNKLADTEQLIGEFSVPRSRNAQLAMLKLHSQGSYRDESSKRLLKKCQKYYEDYAEKTACFQDMRQHIAGLSMAHQRILMANVDRRQESSRTKLPDNEHNSVKFFVSEVNSLKIEYNLLVSRISSINQLNLLWSFVKTCLQLSKAYHTLGHQLPKSDRTPVDDAVILAAMACLHAFCLGQQSALLKATIILEYLLTFSRHHYDALLILARLYLFLGATSISAECYCALNIKNIQYSSLSWTLFSRLSSLHPNSMGLTSSGSQTNVFDPLAELGTALEWYSKASGLTDRSVVSTFCLDQWSNLIGLLATQSSISNGYGKYILSLEAERIQRINALTAKNVDNTHLILKLSGLGRDDRDRSVLANYESLAQSPLRDEMPEASAFQDINPAWLLSQARMSIWWDRLRSEPQLKTSDIEGLESLANTCNTFKAHPDALTSPEVFTYSIWRNLSICLSLLSETACTIPVKLMERNVARASRAIEELIKRLVDSPSGSLGVGIDIFSTNNESDKLNTHLPTWTALHGPFLILDMAAFVRALFLRIEGAMSGEERSIDACYQSILSPLADLRTLTSRLCELVAKDAKCRLDTIRAVSFQEQIVTSVLHVSRPQVSEGTYGLVPTLVLGDFLDRDFVIQCSRRIQGSLMEAFQGLDRTASKAVA